MNAITTTVQAERKSVLMTMAHKYSMEPDAFERTLRATVIPANTSREQFAAFLVVANEYGLSPLTKEIYAFPAKGGGIQPIVSIDGWLNIINSHPKLNGIEFDDHLSQDGKSVTAITVRIWRKDRDKPIVVTEYLAECFRQSEPWQKYPRRMLRHKALIQGARYAFGFAGIVDPDEAERMGAGPMRDVAPRRDEGPPPPSAARIAHQPAPPSPPSAAPEPAETVDETTGEVIDKTERDGVPAFLDKRNGGPLVAPKDHDPVRLFRWIDGLLGTVKDADELETVWNARVAPKLIGMFPPDQEDAMGLYRKHEARFEP